MKSLAVVVVSAFALAACAGLPQPGSSVASEAPAEVLADGHEAADESEEIAEDSPEPAPAKVAVNRHMRADGDDYRYDNGMTLYSNAPGWKGQRQLEIEKVHTLSKSCIAANNTSPACNELIRLNAQMGKLYILQETGSMRAK